MKTYRVKIDVSGIIEIMVTTKGSDYALAIAETIADRLQLNPVCYNGLDISELDERLEGLSQDPEEAE